MEAASRLAVEHRPLNLLLIVVDGIRESVDELRLQLSDPPWRHHALPGLHDPLDYVIEDILLPLFFIAFHIIIITKLTLR